MENHGCGCVWAVPEKVLVKFDLEFETLKISDGKNLVKFGGRTFLPARKARNILGRISERVLARISETSFQISQLFFGIAKSVNKQEHLPTPWRKYLENNLPRVF